MRTIARMGKALAVVGGLLILAGVALGFVAFGECGSVFDPVDRAAVERNAAAAAMMGRAYTGPDCSSSVDLTVPVWLLIAAGVVTVIVAAVVGQARGAETDNESEPAAGNV